MGDPVCCFLQCKDSKLDPLLTTPSSLAGNSTTIVSSKIDLQKRPWGFYLKERGVTYLDDEETAFMAFHKNLLENLIQSRFEEQSCWDERPTQATTMKGNEQVKW